MKKLKPLIYGYIFSRVLRMIHAMRMFHPYMVVFICKYDLNSAYCHMHMNAASAEKYLCTKTICTLIYLQLTFGGLSNPAEWCIIIKILTDLTNDNTNNPFCSHAVFFAKEPNPSKLPPPILDPPIDEFVQALLEDLHLQLPHHGWMNSYIDGIISVCVHMGDNAIRTTKQILLDIYIMARPSSSSSPPTPILHKYLLPIVKMIAESQ